MQMWRPLCATYAWCQAWQTRMSLYVIILTNPGSTLPRPGPSDRKTGDRFAVRKRSQALCILSCLLLPGAGSSAKAGLVGAVRVAVTVTCLLTLWHSQVSQKVLEVISCLADKAPKFPKKCAVLCIPGTPHVPSRRR